MSNVFCEISVGTGDLHRRICGAVCHTTAFRKDRMERRPPGHTASATADTCFFPGLFVVFPGLLWTVAAPSRCSPRSLVRVRPAIGAEKLGGDIDGGGALAGG